MITSEKADIQEAKIASRLYLLLREKYSGFEIKQDYYSDISEIQECEILVGNTNRAESETSILENNKYTVKVVGKKIVINAGSIIALDTACGYFYDYVIENDFAVPKDYIYEGKVDLGSDKKIMVADQSNGGVAIIDVSDPYNTPVIESFVKTMHFRVAGLKVRDTKKYGKIIISCNGSANAEIITYPDMKRVWSTQNTANNPHSVEITPDGKILAVASSTGGAVNFYNTDVTGKKAFSIPFPNAHGVLYDVDNQWFWITGASTVCAYRAEIVDGGSIRITEVEGKRFTLPTPSSHDLQVYCGDINKLWITTDAEVYVFDKTTGKCSISYEYKSDINIGAVKGISNFLDGSITLVTPDGLLESWTSSKIICSYKLNFSNQQLFVEHLLPNNTHIYKVRSFVSDYTF